MKDQKKMRGSERAEGKPFTEISLSIYSGIESTRLSAFLVDHSPKGAQLICGADEPIELGAATVFTAYTGPKMGKIPVSGKVAWVKSQSGRTWFGVKYDTPLEGEYRLD